MEEIRIGDFEKPLVPPKKKEAPAGGEAAERMESAEAQLEQAAVEAEKEIAPLKRYEDALKKLGIDRDEAATIVDALLSQGYWSKEVQITPKRKVKFRTRVYADMQRFYSYIEMIQPKNASYYNEILYKYQLAGSLEAFGGITFAFPTAKSTPAEADELFQKRRDYIETLAEPTVRLLYIHLAKFDEIVRTVTEEGAVENF